MTLLIENNLFYRQLEHNNITRVTQSWLYGLKGLREMWVIATIINMIFEKLKIKKKIGEGGATCTLDNAGESYDTPSCLIKTAERDERGRSVAYGNCLNWCGAVKWHQHQLFLWTDQCLFMGKLTLITSLPVMIACLNGPCV